LLDKLRLVLDLGAAPGSWTQFALERMSSAQARVIAVDRAPLKVTDRRITLIENRYKK